MVITKKNKKECKQPKRHGKRKINKTSKIHRNPVLLDDMNSHAARSHKCAECMRRQKELPPSVQGGKGRDEGCG